jgi:DNA-binding transcriptional MerR regulator
MGPRRSRVLTIGQVAAYAGVTVRAVRHYHQRGLLAEPARDSSGYRRYDADAVVDLLRIKTLSQAGVPLARILELLNAEPEHFSQAITQMDHALTAKIRDLTDHRRALAELEGGESLFLPAEFVDYLDQLRKFGVSPRTVHLERNGWILLVAGSPRLATELLRAKSADLQNPEFRAIYLAYDSSLRSFMATHRAHAIQISPNPSLAPEARRRARTERLYLPCRSRPRREFRH